MELKALGFKSHVNENALKFISEVTEWVQGHSKILGALLVGSYAHNKARLDSDIDIMVFVTDIAPWLQNSEEWLKVFGKVEDWGVVKTLRAFYEEGVEVEFNFTTLDWATIDPIEPNTFRVISDGAKVLYDPLGILTNLLSVVSSGFS
jgi:predicted nucleotidyltransferase